MGGGRRLGGGRESKNYLALFGFCFHGLREARGVGIPSPSISVLFSKGCREARGKQEVQGPFKQIGGRRRRWGVKRFHTFAWLVKCFRETGRSWGVRGFAAFARPFRILRRKGGSGQSKNSSLLVGLSKVSGQKKKIGTCCG